MSQPRLMSQTTSMWVSGHVNGFPKMCMNHQLVMIDGKRTFAVEGVTYHLIKAIDSEVDNRIKESKLQQNKISILISLMALVVAIAAYLNT